MNTKEHISGISHSRAMTIGILIILIGCIVVVVTAVFINRSQSEFFITQRDRFIAGEIAVFMILAVEISSRMIINRLTRRNARQTGIAIRSVLRVICYLIIGIVLVWILADNPSLAIGVGTITGIVAGLAAQATLGNVMSGIVLTLRHPITIGDTVTMVGITGRVTDITLLYTIIDTGDNSVFVPNTTVMNTAIQRKNDDL